MIDRALRFFGTALSFAVFGLGGLCLALLVFPALWLLPGGREAREVRARRIIRASFRAFLWMMESLGVLELELRDLSVLNEDSGTVVVANHPTLIDVILLLAHLEHANCVVKGDLWRNPFLGGVVRAAGYIQNADQDRVLAQCEHVLRSGENIVLFPEGTRSRPGQPLKLKRGAAAIALRAGAPMRLIHISCEPITLTKLEPWYRIPKCRPRFSLRVGERIFAAALVPEGVPPSIATRRLTNVLKQRLTGSGAFSGHVG